MRNACTKCIYGGIKISEGEEVISCSLTGEQHEMYEDELMAMICIDFFRKED